MIHNRFSPCGIKPDAAFTTRGFENMKKATERFLSHDGSAPHNEAKMKWELIFRPTIVQQLSVESIKVQTQRRMGLLKQLGAMKFLLRQGLSLRGHNEHEGNLPQLLSTWREVTDSAHLKHWIEMGRYMSHDIINELITIMGNTVLREILSNIRRHAPGWYSIIGDEATDIKCSEQLNISIRYVDDDYTINEDSIGMFALPDTYAETISSVIRDILLRCCLPISLCRGQAYDGAAVMKGIRSGVAARIRKDVPQALPVHCLAHCLNLCLQDAGKQINLLRDAIQLVREIVQLINCSPKRKHLFSQYCMESILLKSACGEECNSELKSFSESVFQADFSIPQLEKQLAILVDVIRVELPDVKRVTNIRTICTAMEAHRNRSMLSEVHKLLRLFLTIPVTSSTSERSFSAMRRLYTYLRSSMTESRFNNCFILHVHKELAERINLEDVAKEFISRNDERVRYFGVFP